MSRSCVSHVTPGRPWLVQDERCGTNTAFMDRRDEAVLGEAMTVISKRLLRLAGWVRKARIDWFVISLAGTLLAATLLPCRGDSAQAFHAAGIMAIAILFFLQGARLSRDAILNGVMHWRLHVFVASTTFILFPLIGLGLAGVLFICALPSTIQSSIALTSESARYRRRWTM
jgi:hypothetical protein